MFKNNLVKAVHINGSLWTAAFEARPIKRDPTQIQRRRHFGLFVKVLNLSLGSFYDVVTPTGPSSRLFATGANNVFKTITCPKLCKIS